MRYIDSGDRAPGTGVGAWLESELDAPESVRSFSVQSGYFSLADDGGAVELLRQTAGAVTAMSFVVGSNAGQTRKADVQRLLLLGASSINVGVVAYANGLFHPKVYLIQRVDGSRTAFVGSANFTRRGIEGANVEAGIVLDEREGDPGAILDQVSGAINRWFTDEPPGFYPVRSSSDVEALAAIGVLDQPVVTTPRTHLGTLTVGRGSSRTPASLTPIEPFKKRSGRIPSTARVWSKVLSQSDAQRKAVGNQRGAISLVQGDLRGHIDQRVYFRNELFLDAEWELSATLTGKPKESAVVPMDVSIAGSPLERHSLEITHAVNRAADQNNYTTTLHLGSLAKAFASKDLTGMRMSIRQKTSDVWELRVEEV